MRIVIDLQSGEDQAALALACDLAAECGAAHQLIVAISNRQPSAINAVRLALTGLLPREQVRVYDLPADDSGSGAHWRSQAAALIRAQFLASLAPDELLLAEALPDVASARELLEQLAQQDAPAPATPQARPRLAYISPLPPEHSGIADYSAELVPQLAQYYDIELIVDQAVVLDARLSDYTPRDLAWFEQNAHRFERLVYHFGNSHMHRHMFELIRRHPGIVVLHDFFVSGILDNLEREGALAHGFLKALYESHGYSGLLEHRKNGRNPAIWAYPLNKGVLDNASGVIVHSDFSKQLARDWYGPDAADGWRTVPLLRGKGAQAPTRDAARARLKLKDADYLVCSFGMLGPIKLNEELLDAFLASKLAADPHCKLVFVGQNEGGRYGAAMNQKIAASGAAKRITITGFATPDTYADYLAACDCAVQLRSATRGETSAAVLDCLLYGAPTIVNAHGSSAAIDAALLLKLPDQFTTPELSAALEQLHADAGLRASYAQHAQAYMQAEHTPGHVGRLYAEAIEQFTLHGAHGHYRALLAALGSIPGPAEPTDADLADAAQAIAFNQPPRAPRQLLVDVSAVVHSDLKTGIQRVVRSVLLALIASPPAGYRVEPVYSLGGNRSYHYARQFGLGMVGETGLALEDAPVELRPGDIFLGLDLFTNGIAQNEGLLQSMREHGVAIYFVVFDILPMLRPEVFPFGTEQYFGDFLRTVSKVADGLLCISRAVADELITWIGQQQFERKAPLQVGYFHLGADIDASAPSFGLPDNAAQVFAAVRARPSFLMVGTVEPRKGHTQALAAFELLWEQGAQLNLVIVGKQGWMVDKLVERMASHPEKDVRLFWLPGVSDEMLLQLYASSAALLAPSEGEGFGLPLIEAAQHHIPIIARELPVFREVAGEHAHYFEGKAPADLAASIEAWLALKAAGTAPGSDGMSWLTWSDSAQQVVSAVVGQRWYRVL